MSKELEYIDYGGYRYWYEYRLAKDRVDICLAKRIQRNIVMDSIYIQQRIQETVKLLL